MCRILSVIKRHFNKKPTKYKEILEVSEIISRMIYFLFVIFLKWKIIE